VPETSIDARAASPRTHARQALPPSSLDAAPSPVQAGRNLQSLLLGAHAARAEPAGSLPQPAASGGLVLSLEDLFPNRYG
jgi:hypothetical protein